jgi:hypothetical protein
VASDIRPSRVDVWTAKSLTLDFRDSQWSSAPARRLDDGFVYQQRVPAEGYAAVLGEAVFNEGTDEQLWLSTNVRIIPANGVGGGK